jgi:uncharacterized protein (UPF0335 family)
MADTILDTEAAKKLTSYIEKIERLEEDKSGINDDIKDTFTMAKMVGYDPKIMKIILKLRKRSTDEVEEEDALVEVYKSALGMTI